MRMLIKLKSLMNLKYTNDYAYGLHSFVYSLLKNTQFEDIHYDAKIKYFVYSNIFPVKDFSYGSNFYFIISTYDISLYNVIKNNIINYIDNEILIGDLKFSIIEIKDIFKHIRNGCVIITSTPIALKDVNGLWWGYNKSKKDVNRFLELISSNMTHKYNSYYNTNNEFDINSVVDSYTFKRTTAITMNIRNNDNFVIGSKWIFKLKNIINPIDYKILSFNFHCGFGQKTAFGFGMMNIKEFKE